MTQTAVSETGVEAPRGPRGIPLLGNLPAMGKDPLGFITSCARDYGDVVALRFGSWPAALLSNPEHLETLLVKQHRNFVKNRFSWRQVKAIFGNGLLTAEGEDWARQRRLAAPAFTGERLRSYGDVMVRLTGRMLDGWHDGDVRDVHHDMMALTLRIAAKTLFDSEVERDVEEIDHAVSVLTDEIAVRFARPFVIPDIIPLPGHIRYRRALRNIEAVVAHMIAERRTSGRDTGDFLSMLMQARDENGEPMSDKLLRDEVITLLLAGHETTALSLSWTLYLLGQHSNIDAEVATEIREVLGGRAPGVADLERLKLTESVIQESMRLFPPAWAIGRENLEDCEIGGHHFPAGTTFLASPWVIQRNPYHFPDPETFRPERWADGLERKIPRFAFFPFGGGPRVCIGQRFAMMEAILLLATMIQRFRFEWQSERTVEPFPSITLRPKGGVWVRLHKR